LSAIKKQGFFFTNNSKYYQLFVSSLAFLKCIKHKLSTFFLIFVTFICAIKYLHIYLQANHCVINKFMETRRDVFQAIADPTRREIINLIAQKSQNLNSIADNFDVSRQAISLHIKILQECGLISIKQQGRERYCEAKLQQLRQVSTWIEQHRKLWEERFDAIDNILEELKTKKKGPLKKTTKR
jgi:DNA-binding transcriptional ArsR family regulator